MFTDEQLIQQIESNSEDALMELYGRYGRLVKGMAFRVLQDDAIAEEVVQDVFLKLWRQPERWSASRGRISTYLMAITRNAAIDRLRSEQRRPVHTAVSTEDAAAELSQDPVVDDPVWLEGHMLRQMLEQLPEDRRTMVELAYFQGMTHSELADFLDLPLGTVKTRLRRGLQQLRDLWESGQ
jgi:RNA polymerase sigma-70 factor (ECF subfamily)